MGTKRSNRTFSTLQVSDQHAFDSSHQGRERSGRDPSPRPRTKTWGDREREWNREEELRREKEPDRMRVRTYDGEREMAQNLCDRERARNRERDRDKRETAPGMREGERERRYTEIRWERVNGKGIVAEGMQEWSGEKGGTFPRMGKPSRERDVRMGRVIEEEGERTMMKRLERQKGLEMEDVEIDKRKMRDPQRDRERDMQRYREIERDRQREHKRNGREQREKDGDRWRGRPNEFDTRFRERRREERDMRNRDMDIEREISKHRQREREVDINLPQRNRITEKEMDNFSDRGGRREKEWRREGWRDTKSDGDSDGDRRKRRGRESEQVVLSHKHSKSEGDGEGERKREKPRDKDRNREAERYREREREFQGGKYREMDRRGEWEGEIEVVKPRDRVRQREEERDAERRRDRGNERERGEKEDDRYRDRERERKYDKERQGRTWEETSKNSEKTQTHKTRGREAEEEMVREREWHTDRKEEKRLVRTKEKQRVREAEDPGGRESNRDSELLKEMLMKTHDRKELKSESDVERGGEADLIAERFREGDVESEGKIQGGREPTGRQDVPVRKQIPIKKIWLEPQKVTGRTELGKYAEMEKARDERYSESNVQKARHMQGQEERWMDSGKGKSVQHTEEEERVSVDSDKGEDSERCKQTGAPFYGDEEAESMSDDEKVQTLQGQRCVTDSPEGSDGDVEIGRSSGSQREFGGDGERGWSGEDGFITVSSGGEEEEGDEEDHFQDCKEFLEGEVRGINEGLRKEISDQEESLNTERGSETTVDTKEEENGKDTPSRVTVFCVIGQTLPRTRCDHGGILDKTGKLSENLEQDIGGGDEITNAVPTDGQTGDKEREKGGQDVESEQPDKEKETDEGSTEKVDQICTLEEERKEENPGIDERNDPEERMREEVADVCPRNIEREHSGNMMTAESETETETCQEKQESKETEPHSPVITERSGERDLGGIGTESHSGTKQGDASETEPIIQTPDDLRKAEERRKEDSAQYIKWAKDVVREILGSSGDATLEGIESPQIGVVIPGMPQSGQETDGEKGSPIYATVQKTADARVFTDPPAESEGDMPVYAQIQKKRDRCPDSLTGSETNTGMQMDRDFESHKNTHIQIQIESVAVRESGTGEDTWALAGQGGKTETEEGLDGSFTRVSLTKCNSCPSPDKSPYPRIIVPELFNVGNEEREKEGVSGEVGSTGSFRDQGNKARERRRGIRKTTKRSKEEETEEDPEEGGRDRRTRVFNESDDYDELSYSWSEADLRTATDAIGKMKNRNSKFFNSQLYQQYSEVALNREILSQSRTDSLSICEDVPGHSYLSPAPSPPPARRPLPPLPPVPHPHSLSHANSFSNTSALTLPLPLLPGPSSPRLSRSLPQSPTLWQDLPGVRNSRELSELGEDERRLQEVRFEVVTSEASYCRSLDIVIEHFVKSKELGTLLTTQDRNWLFSRLGDVRAISHSFLGKLEERVEKDIMQFSVCDIIVHHCPRFRVVYVPYLTNQSYQDKTYQRLMEENPGFRRLVEKLERNSVCQRLPLRSFLILPFQRITRLKLLVQNIVKRITPNTEEEIQAIKALKLLEKLIQEGNDSITQMKSIESLVCLSGKVDFECKTLPLVSQSRRLVREGSVTELRDFALKESERTLYLHLFNDYLLLSLRKEGGRFIVINHAPVSELRVENCRVKLHSLQKNLFRLHLSRKALLVRTDTQSDKLRWMSALSRPHPQIDFSAAQDINQVQCIKAFVAQQPDELNLEKADVLLVHQQSSDGWIEGTRLSDRQRGWAPESHLETITSSRARQRNLLDTHKITTITATY